MTTFYLNPYYSNAANIDYHIAAQLLKKGAKRASSSWNADILIGTDNPVQGRKAYGYLFGSNKGIMSKILRRKPYMPKTYHDQAKTKPGQMYFVKPKKGSKGIGISIVHGHGQTISKYGHLIQEAVPSLILPFAGSPPRKFDLRFYASLTLLPSGKCEIVTDDDAYMKFSSSAYVKGRASTEITNVARQDPRGFKKCLCMLSKYKERDLMHLIPLMKEYAEDALQTCFDELMEKSRFKGSTVGHIYGFDFIITEDGLDVKILEINAKAGVKGRLTLGPFNPLPLLPALVGKKYS